MKQNTLNISELTEFLKSNGDATRFPWTLDTCNGEFVIVKDSGGNVVLFEDMASLNDMPSGTAERIGVEIQIRARALVKLSEILANL